MDNFQHTTESSEITSDIHLESLSTEGNMSIDSNQYYENINQSSVTMVYRYQLSQGSMVPFDTTVVPVSANNKPNNSLKTDETVDLLEAQNSVTQDMYDHGNQLVSQPLYILPDSQTLFLDNRNLLFTAESSDSIPSDFNLTSTYESGIPPSQSLNQYPSIYNASNIDTDGEVALTLASLGDLKPSGMSNYHEPEPQKEIFESVSVDELEKNCKENKPSVAGRSEQAFNMKNDTICSKENEVDHHITKNRKLIKKKKETLKKDKTIDERDSQRDNLLGQLLKASKHCAPDSLVPETVVDYVIPAVGYRIMDMSNLSEMIRMMHRCSNSSVQGTIVTQEQLSLRQGAVSHLSIICTGCQEGTVCATSNKSSHSWDINERVELLSKEFNLEEKDVQRMLEILGIFYRPCPKPIAPVEQVSLPQNQIKTSIVKQSKKKTDDVKTRFVCKTCNKSFQFRNQLKSHSSIHDNALHNCPYCKAYFKKTYNLREHVKKHTNQKYSCAFCPKLYSDRSTLSTHIRHIHEKREPKHSCEYCGKKFYVLMHCKEHLRVHTNDKPYECESCHKRFSYQSSLKKHMITHFTSCKYKCRLCGKWFRWMIGVRKHLLQQHKLKKSDIEAQVLTAVTDEVPRGRIMLVKENNESPLMIKVPPRAAAAIANVKTTS